MGKQLTSQTVTPSNRFEPVSTGFFRAGKPGIFFNHAEPARITKWDGEDFLLGHGTRPPLTTHTLGERNRLVEFLAPNSVYKKHMIARAANKMLLGGLVGLLTGRMLFCVQLGVVLRKRLRQFKRLQAVPRNAHPKPGLPGTTG